jgi:hypothetical protein
MRRTLCKWRRVIFSAYILIYNISAFKECFQALDVILCNPLTALDVILCNPLTALDVILCNPLTALDVITKCDPE